MPLRKYRIKIHYELIRAISESFFEPFQVIPNQTENPYRLMENDQTSIRLNSIESEWTRTYTNQVFDLNQSELGLIQIKFLIRINRSSKWFGFIMIENPVWINPSSDWFRLKILFVFIQINFQQFFIKQDTNRFLYIGLELLGMIRKLIPKWFGLALHLIHAKKCVAGKKKHIVVSAILLTILSINVADIT